MGVYASAEVRDRAAGRDKSCVLQGEERQHAGYHWDRDVQCYPRPGALTYYAPFKGEWLSVVQIAPYFAKVECFCFEEQKLLAGEEVDMPLLFFIDKDILDDPACRGLDDVVLSYTFFK